MKKTENGSHPATHVSGKDNAGTGFKPVAAGRTSRPALIGGLITLGAVLALMVGAGSPPQLVLAGGLATLGLGTAWIVNGEARASAAAALADASPSHGDRLTAARALQWKGGC
jgi:hypothetical protein